MEIVIFDVSRYSNSIRNWWVSLVMGILYIIVGGLIFFRPGEGYLSLAFIFGGIVLLSGLSEIFIGSGTPPQAGKGRLIAAGIIELLLGILLMIIPYSLLFYLPFLLGFWIMFRGYWTISNSSDMVGYGIKGAGWTLLLAILVVITSFVVLANPFIGLGYTEIWLGCAFVLTGIASVVYATHLSHLKKYQRP